LSVIAFVPGAFFVVNVIREPLYSFYGALFASFLMLLQAAAQFALTRRSRLPATTRQLFFLVGLFGLYPALAAFAWADVSNAFNPAGISCLLTAAGLFQTLRNDRPST